MKLKPINPSNLLNRKFLVPTLKTSQAMVKEGMKVNAKVAIGGATVAALIGIGALYVCRKSNELTQEGMAATKDLTKSVEDVIEILGIKTEDIETLGTNVDEICKKIEEILDANNQNVSVINELSEAADKMIGHLENIDACDDAQNKEIAELKKIVAKLNNGMSRYMTDTEDRINSMIQNMVNKRFEILDKDLTARGISKPVQTPAISNSDKEVRKKIDEMIDIINAQSTEIKNLKETIAEMKQGADQENLARSEEAMYRHEFKKAVDEEMANQKKLILNIEQSVRSVTGGLNSLTAKIEHDDDEKKHEEYIKSKADNKKNEKIDDLEKRLNALEKEPAADPKMDEEIKTIKRQIKSLAFVVPSIDKDLKALIETVNDNGHEAEDRLSALENAEKDTTTIDALSKRVDALESTKPEAMQMDIPGQLEINAKRIDDLEKQLKEIEDRKPEMNVSGNVSVDAVNRFANELNRFRTSTNDILQDVEKVLDSHENGIKDMQEAMEHIITANKQTYEIAAKSTPVDKFTLLTEKFNKLVEMINNAGVEINMDPFQDAINQLDDKIAIVTSALYRSMHTTIGLVDAVETGDREELTEIREQYAELYNQYCGVTEDNINEDDYEEEDDQLPEGFWGDEDMDENDFDTPNNGLFDDDDDEEADHDEEDDTETESSVEFVQMTIEEGSVSDDVVISESAANNLESDTVEAVYVVTDSSNTKVEEAAIVEISDTPMKEESKEDDFEKRLAEASDEFEREFGLKKDENGNKIPPENNVDLDDAAWKATKEQIRSVPLGYDWEKNPKNYPKEIGIHDKPVFHALKVEQIAMLNNMVAGLPVDEPAMASYFGPRFKFAGFAMMEQVNVARQYFTDIDNAHKELPDIHRIHAELVKRIIMRINWGAIMEGKEELIAFYGDKIVNPPQCIRPYFENANIHDTIYIDQNGKEITAEEFDKIPLAPTEKVAIETEDGTIYVSEERAKEIHAKQEEFMKHDAENPDDITMTIYLRDHGEEEFIKTYGENNLARAKELLKNSMMDMEAYWDSDEDEELDLGDPDADDWDIEDDDEDEDDEMEEEVVDFRQTEAYKKAEAEAMTRAIARAKTMFAEQKSSEEPQGATDENCGFPEDDGDDDEEDEPIIFNVGGKKMMKLTDEQREQYRKEANNSESIFTGLFDGKYDEAFAEEKRKRCNEIADSGMKEIWQAKNLKEEDQILGEKIKQKLQGTIPEDVVLNNEDQAHFKDLNAYYQTLVHVHANEHFRAKAQLKQNDEWFPDEFKDEVKEYMVEECGLEQTANWDKVSIAVRQAWLHAKKELNLDTRDILADPIPTVVDAVYDHYGLGDVEDVPMEDLIAADLEEEYMPKMNRAQKRMMKKRGKNRQATKKRR